MGRYKKLLSIVSLAVMTMSLSIVASAQWRDSRGNGGYYGNNQYRNLNSTIKNLRSKASRFKSDLDHELDRSTYNGTRYEDDLNRLAGDFRSAVRRLDGAYDNNRDYDRSRDEAQRVLRYGSQLNSALSRARINRNRTLSSQWNSIQRDLRTISNAYGYNSYNNRNGRYNPNRRGTYNRNRRTNNSRRGTIYGRDNRRGRYNQNLRYTISNLKRKANRFEDLMDNKRHRNRNGSRYGRTNLESLADRFLDAAKDLEDEYDGGRDHYKSRDEVDRVLRLGSEISREISRGSASRTARSQWRQIEQDLRTIARAYNLRYNGNSGRLGRISDIWNNFPF